MLSYLKVVSGVEAGTHWQERFYPPREILGTPFIDSNACLFHGGAQGQAAKIQQKNVLAGMPAHDRAQGGVSEASSRLLLASLSDRGLCWVEHRASVLDSDTPGLDSQASPFPAGEPWTASKPAWGCFPICKWQVVHPLWRGYLSDKYPDNLPSERRK